MVEGALAACFREIGVEIATPFRRMTYAEAIAVYGSDKPDLRFDLKIQDVGALFAQSPFGIFREAVEHGGTVRGFVIPGAGGSSRKEARRAERTGQAGRRGRAGLGPAHGRRRAVVGEGDRRGRQSPRCSMRCRRAPATWSCWRRAPRTPPSKMLGQLRLLVARKRNLIPEGRWELLWLTDFPLFDWNADERRWDSVNHPFTAPREEDLHLLESDPGKVLAKAYDVILNGWELGGGSIRIHDRQTQATVFRLLGLSDEQARHALRVLPRGAGVRHPAARRPGPGTRPRLALLAGESSIREVIPFPKTTQAVDLMCEAPSPVDPAQLRELRLIAPRLDPAPRPAGCYDRRES